jgi:hypothetical protein
LNLERQLSVGHTEPEVILFVLNPPLIKDEEEVISGAEYPLKATLPSEISRIRIKLNQIVKCQERSEGVVGASAVDTRHKIALLEPGKCLIQTNARQEMGRNLIAEIGRELIRVARIVISEPPGDKRFPSPFRCCLELQR